MHQIHSETGSRIFAGCRLLTSRRVDDWVSTYHSWEQPYTGKMEWRGDCADTGGCACHFWMFFPKVTLLFTFVIEVTRLPQIVVTN